MAVSEINTILTMDGGSDDVLITGAETGMGI